MADYTGYLDPSIVNYVQGVAPTDLGLYMQGPQGSNDAPVPPSPPPAPPPQPVPAPAPTPAPSGKTTLGPRGRNSVGLFGAPDGEETYGLPPEVIAHVQGGGESTAPSVTGGALPPTDPGMVAPAAPSPDLAPVAVPQLTPKTLAASNKQYDKQQAAQAAYDASPEGLAARADNEQRQAIGHEQQANADALAAEQAQNTATSNALTASAQRQAAQDKIDQQRIAEQQANVDKYTQQYAQQVKDAADYKVDTNRDVGVRGLIAIALSGIGDALDHIHGPNKAAQIIESQIDKRISDQWAQKGALKDKANSTLGVLDQFRRGADDDRQAQALHTAAETKRVADEIRQIGAQYANPAAKARAEAVAAQLDGKAAAITQGEAQRKAQAIKDAQEERDRQAQIGIAQGHLGLARQQFTASRTDADRDWALRVAELDAKKGGADARAAASKDLATNGVFDASTGSAVLTADGQKMIDQADALEIKARTLPPDQATAARQQAAQMRQDAELLYGFRIEDKEARREVVNSVGAGQKLVDTIGRIKDQLAKDPSFADRTAWAGLHTDLESAKADWIEMHKGKPSSREFDAIGPMFGDDVTSLTTRIAGKGKMEEALKHLESVAISDTTTDLHKHGYKGTWRPRGLDREEVTPLSGKTSVEAGEDATQGAASFLNPFAGAAQLGHQAYNAVTGEKSQTPQAAAEEGGDLTPTGLSKADTATVQGLVNRYKNATDADRGKILTQLTTYASSDRLSLASGVLGLVKQDPQLYASVVSNLSPQQQGAIGADTRSPAEWLRDVPIDQLSMAAAVGDAGAKAEILGRAHNGDKLAQQALVRLLGAR